MDPEELEQVKTFRDRVSTVTDKGKRKWVYAFQPNGRFYKYRNLVSYLYVIVFFLLPFIHVNGMPLLMFNIPEGKFIIFTKIFWPQDFFIFAVAMITFIIFIALFTVIYGRLFCGWVCPQTVFMEFLFRKIEWWIEGPPAKQQNMDAGPWNANKAIRKALKHFIFFVLSFIITNTFLAYIFGLDGLLKIIREPINQHYSLLGGLIIFTYLFYAVYAYVRELVCTTVCPYGRLQSVLFDKDTMQIAYDYGRGEPRGKVSKHRAVELGDCVDCKKCVQVCPTGIDIRNGLQMECVGCTACIDACDEMMDKVGYARGLIRYASENQISKKRKFHFNGRMKAYTVLLGLLIVLMSVLIVTRRTVDAYVSRVKGQLYTEVGTDKLSNLYMAKIINKTNQDIPVELRLESMPGSIELIGHQEIVLKKEEVNQITFFVVVDKSQIHERSTKVKLGLYRDGERIETVNSTFLGPFI